MVKLVSFVKEIVVFGETVVFSRKVLLWVVFSEKVEDSCFVVTSVESCVVHFVVFSDEVCFVVL